MWHVRCSSGTVEKQRAVLLKARDELRAEEGGEEESQPVGPNQRRKRKAAGILVVDREGKKKRREEDDEVPTLVELPLDVPSTHADPRTNGGAVGKLRKKGKGTVEEGEGEESVFADVGEFEVPELAYDEGEEGEGEEEEEQEDGEDDDLAMIMGAEEEDEEDEELVAQAMALNDHTADDADEEADTEEEETEMREEDMADDALFMDADAFDRAMAEELQKPEAKKGKKGRQTEVLDEPQGERKPEPETSNGRTRRTAPSPPSRFLDQPADAREVKKPKRQRGEGRGDGGAASSEEVKEVEAEMDEAPAKAGKGRKQKKRSEASAYDGPLLKAEHKEVEEQAMASQSKERKRKKEGTTANGRSQPAAARSPTHSANGNDGDVSVGGSGKKGKRGGEEKANEGDQLELDPPRSYSGKKKRTALDRPVEEEGKAAAAAPGSPPASKASSSSPSQPGFLTPRVPSRKSRPSTTTTTTITTTARTTSTTNADDPSLTSSTSSSSPSATVLSTPTSSRTPKSVSIRLEHNRVQTFHHWKKMEVKEQVDALLSRPSPKPAIKRLSVQGTSSSSTAPDRPVKKVKGRLSMPSLQTNVSPAVKLAMVSPRNRPTAADFF